MKQQSTKMLKHKSEDWVVHEDANERDSNSSTGSLNRQVENLVRLDTFADESQFEELDRQCIDDMMNQSIILGTFRDTIGNSSPTSSNSNLKLSKRDSFTSMGDFSNVSNN